MRMLWLASTATVGGAVAVSSVSFGANAPAATGAARGAPTAPPPLATRAAARPATATSAAPLRARVIATTDGEQDDLASMHRFILYANDLDIAGIIQTTSRFHHAGDLEATPPISQVTWLGSDWIHAIIRNYAVAYPNLKANDPNYPTPEYLDSVVKVGNITDVGEYAKNTEGSEWIKKILLDNDPRPVYISVWGGTNVVAAALRSIHDEYYGKPGWDAIQRKVSNKTWLLIDLDQDATYKDYVAKVWPDVNVVMNNRQFGAFAYGWGTDVPAELKSYYQAAFQQSMIRKGPIESDYSLASGSGTGDVGGGRGAARDWFSEGDSPQFIQQFPIGLSDLAHYNPAFGNWGGRYIQKGPHLWVDNPPYLGFTGAPVADYSPYVGAADFPTTTLAQAVAAGATRVRLASVANLSPRDIVTIGGQQKQVASVGTAAGAATKLSLAANAGATSVRLDSVAGIEVGQPITIDTGATQETRTVTRVGKAATRTTLSRPAAAGATNLKLANTANLTVGDSLTVGTGGSAQTVKVTAVRKPSADYVVARAATTLAAGAATLSEASTAGGANIKLNRVTNFLKGQTVQVGTGAGAETVTLDTVGVGGGATLGLPSVAGSKNVKILSTANFVAGGRVWVGSGADMETATIWTGGIRYPAQGADQEGTRAAGATTLSEASTAGARAVKVANPAGFLVGAPVTIDTGANAEAVHLSFVAAGPAGSPVELDIVEPLQKAHAAGAPIAASGLTFDNPLARAHAAGEMVTANAATLSAALRQPHASGADVVTVTPAGTRVLKVASVAGFNVGGQIVLDTGADAETLTIASVGTAGLGGTGLTLRSATTKPHLGAAAIEQVPAQAGSSNIKLANVPPPPAPAGAPAGGRGGAPGGAAGGFGGGGGGGFGGGRGGAAPVVMDPLAVGQRITIGTGGDAEEVTITAVGTGGLAGTGVTFTPALRRDHSGNVTVASAGAGVTIAPALTAAQAAGAAASADGAGVSFSPALSQSHGVGAVAQGLGSGVVLTSPLVEAVAAGGAFRNAMNSYYPQTRWSAQIQNDFASRVDWQLKPYAQANHAPVVKVTSRTLTAKAGATVRLNGSASDPDGNGLKYSWWQYREPGTYPGAVEVSGASSLTASFKVPADARPGQTIHMILEVEDAGTPPLTRYQRVVVTVAK